MKTLTILFLMVGITNLAISQTSIKGKITGEVRDENQKPLPFATIMLLQASDSTLVKGEISNDVGKYSFQNILEGQYKIAITMMGYKKLFSNSFRLNSSNSSIVLEPLQMKLETQSLNEVVVVGQKPFIEQKIDRTVVNVENSIVATGGTAMEVLQRAPGVMVDKDDVISLTGKQGVVIMIDGKPTNLSTTDVANMLRNMSSNTIESIELITNPSAKYDAAGNAGIINIKLKKSKNMGMNGSASIGTGYGKFEKYNTDHSCPNKYFL